VTYRIAIERSALKTLASIDKPQRRRIQGAIDGLADNPRPAGAIMLTGRHGELRIRVGDYRIIYRVDDGELVVLIIEIDHRSEIYR
jgi:mRNA interferase RelE/StbE